RHIVPWPDAGCRPAAIDRMGARPSGPDDHRRRRGMHLWRHVLPQQSRREPQLLGQSRFDRPRPVADRSARAAHRLRRGRRVMSGPDRPRPAQRIGARTPLQKLLSRFHFGITLFAVALSGLTILLAGVTALRGYADRNM